MLSNSGNTRNLKIRRKILLTNWIIELKAGQGWRDFVWDGGGLKLIESRAEMGKRDPECKSNKWGEDYFRSGHWSHEYRVDFENWVQIKLSSHADRYTLRKLYKGAHDLPGWISNEKLSTRVMDLILEQYDIRIEAEQKSAKLQLEVSKLKQKVMQLETLKKHLTDPAMRNAFEEHYTNSVRTLRYNAGIDIDLSQQDL